MRRSSLMRFVLAACGLSLTPALSQESSSVVTWGEYGSSTEARDGVFVAVAAGDDCTAVIRADGRAFVNGQNVPATCEVPYVPGRRYTAISVRQLAYGLLDDGTIVGWTGGYVWQLWPGGVAPPAPPLPPGVRYTDVAVGVQHGVALRSDGALVTWGDNVNGQLNVPPLPPGAGYSRIHAGFFHTFALLTDGTIQAWGDNTYGQLNVPPLPPGIRYVAMDAGQYHSVALRSDGALVGWGLNVNGQCNVPLPPPGTRYLLACAGYFHSAAYRSDGQLVQWGAMALPSWAPVPAVPAQRRCTQLVAGNNHTVALLDDGSVLTWGYNGFRQGTLPTPGTTPKARRYTSLATGPFHSLAVRADGSIVGWGDDWFGESTPPPTFAGMQFAKVGAGLQHSVALRRDGALFAWGDTSLGRCNVPPIPAGVTYVDVAVADSHNLALRSDGEAVVFGYTPFGSGNIPPLPPGTRYEAVDCIYSKSILLRSDGAIVYAGTTSSGQGAMPSAPPGLRFVDVAVGRDYNAALLSDGAVVLWGGYANGTPPPGWRPVPALPFGVYYVDIDGAYWVTVLRRSDGLVDVAGLVTTREDKVPPLEPGTSYVEVSASVGATLSARAGPTSTYVSFTPGCAGSLQPARLIPRDTPSIGKTLPVNVFDLPHSLAIMLLGFQRLTPAFPLAALGMPNCDLHASPDLAFPMAGTQNQAQWKLTIPDDQGLVGVHFFNQAIVFDAAAGNSLGAVMSNATEGVIGHW